jgi:RNA polymerase sigma-70 factor (sigma-E family)
MTAASEGVALVTESAAGDTGVSDLASRPETFDAWVAARGPSLVRFAHLITGNTSDAQDAVQDALVAAYPRWGQLCARGTQEAYVRRSIVNRHISIWRSFGRRERPVAEPSELEESAPAKDHASDLADAQVAWRLCLTLPRVQRAAVVLRFYDDQSFAQIAEVLGCKESTARSHVRRALAALREQLEQGGDTDD